MLNNNWVTTCPPNSPASPSLTGPRKQVEGWGGGSLAQMWKVDLTGTVRQTTKLQRERQGVQGAPENLLWVLQQRLQVSAQQGLKEAIWLVPTVVFGTMCSAESPTSGGELQNLNPHCESHWENVPESRVAFSNGCWSQDPGETAGGCAGPTCVSLPHTPLSPP